MQNLKLYSKAEVAQMLGVSVRTISRAIERGEIKTTTLNGSPRIPHAELMRISSAN